MITFKNAENIDNRIAALGAAIKRQKNKDFPLAVVMPCKFQIVIDGKREQGLRGDKLVFKDFNTPAIVQGAK